VSQPKSAILSTSGPTSATPSSGDSFELELHDCGRRCDAFAVVACPGRAAARGALLKRRVHARVLCPALPISGLVWEGERLWTLARVCMTSCEPLCIYMWSMCSLCPHFEGTCVGDRGLEALSGLIFAMVRRGAILHLRWPDWRTHLRTP
jgi:hypothetical protein